MSETGSESEVRCACGKPLHYTDPVLRQMVERLIEGAGDQYVTVHCRGRAWRVQRHYIALHGLKAGELEHLGFPELRDENQQPPLISEPTIMRPGDADCYMVENPLGRWVIVKTEYPGLAWSGSRWVPHRNGVPSGGVQISNFETRLAALEEAEKAALRPAVKGFRLDDGSITCFVCGMTSHNPHDAREKYCGNCHAFHQSDQN